MRVGQRIGPYEVVDELGRGGMGVVYRARHPELDHEVALKVILPDQYGYGPSEEQVKRFQREAKAAAALAGHPNIVGVVDAGAEGDELWLAMELVPGQPLDALIEPDVDRSFEELARWTMEAARAVQHAHDHGILHRDLKPANIMIDDAGTARVTDFGLARRTEADAQTMKLTRSDAIVGTPAFMAPEQALGDDLDGRADVYALGATLHAALTGAPPHGEGSILELLTRVIQNDPKPPRALNPAVPVDLDTIVMCCLEKQPERRYPTAAALADDLERFLDGQRVLATRPGPVRRVVRWMQSHRLATAVGAVAVLAGAALALGIWWASAKQAGERERTDTAASDTALADEARTVTALFRALSRASLPHLRRLEDHQNGVRLEPEALEQLLASLEQDLAAAARAQGVPAETPQVRAWLAFGRFLARDDRATAKLGELREVAARRGNDPFPAMLLARALLTFYADVSTYPAWAVTEQGVEAQPFEEVAGQAEARGHADTAMKAARASSVWPLLKVGGEYAVLADAVDLLQQSEAAAAAGLLRDLMTDPGLEATAARLGAVAAMQARDHKLAAEMLEAVAVRDWADAWAQAANQHMNRGVVAQAAGEDPLPYWKRAEHCVGRALALVPGSRGFLGTRAVLSLERGRLSDDPTEQSAWLTQSIADATAAIVTGGATRLLLLNRGNARARLGRVRAGAGDFRSAHTLFDTALEDSAAALELAPNNANALSVRAMTLLWRGEAQRAQGQDPTAAFREAVRALDLLLANAVQPAARHYVNRGQLLAALSAALGNGSNAAAATLRRSREDLNTAVQMEPDNAAAWRSLGMTMRAMAISDLRRRQDPQAAIREALAAFSRALELDDADWDTHSKLGAMYTVQARWQATQAVDPVESLARARAALSRAQELAPDESYPYNERGLAWLAEANWLEQTQQDPVPAYTAGLADYDAAIARDPNHALTYMRRGALLQAWGGYCERTGAEAWDPYRRAAADYDEAVRRMPGHLDAATRAALVRVPLVRMALQQQRDPGPDALAGLQAAHRVAILAKQIPHRVSLIRYEFARLLKRWDDAGKAVADALKFDPNNDFWLQKQSELARLRGR